MKNFYNSKVPNTLYTTNISRQKGFKFQFGKYVLKILVHVHPENYTGRLVIV